jgi:hypothetical protein
LTPRSAQTKPLEKRPVYAFAAFLLILGAALIVVGVHDASLADRSFGVKTSSAVLLVVGVVLWVAAWQLVRLCRAWRCGKRPPCNPIVVLAFLLAALFGVYVFFSAIARSAGAQWPLVVSTAVVILVFAAGGLLLFGDDVELTRARVSGGVAIAVVGIAVGAWEFWYQNQYMPSHAGRAVALKVDLRRAGRQATFDVIRATVDYEAIGGKSVLIIGSAYTLTGSRVDRCPRSATVLRVAGFFKGFLTDPQRLRFMANVREETPTVLAAGKFAGDGKRLDPNVPAERGFVFLVPRHRYQLLRFRAQLFAIPGSVHLSQRAVPEYKLYRDNELYAYWHVDDDSWLHDLIYGRERWVLIRYELVDPGDKSARNTPANETPVTQALRVTARFPRPTWSKGKPDEKATQLLFDITEPPKQRPSDASEPFAGTELALESVSASCP